jgi:RimJ/RimL family protein N-acetyltransferase
MSYCFPERLTSDRLELRKLRKDDAEGLCAYRSLPEVARYQSWESFDLKDAVRLIESQSEAEPGIPGTWLQLAIVNAASQELIGDCGLHFRKDDPRQVEIGITLSPRFQGHGNAGEAVECVLQYVFGRLDIHRVFASIDVLNLSAIALFRQLGFRQEAYLVENVWFKGQWGSEHVFALLKREWLERGLDGKSEQRIQPS